MKTKGQKRFEQKVEKQKEFANRLALMKVEAVQLGLLKTHGKLDAVLNQVGWEIAEQINEECA